MDKWTSIKTFEQWIEDTVPSGKYDETVLGLFQEEQRGGKYEYLRGNHTLYDIDLSKRQNLLVELKDSLELKKKQIVDLQQKIQAETKADKRKQLDAGIDSLYVERYALEDEIQHTSTLVDHLAIADHVWKGYFVSLRRLVNLYKINKNKEFLRKGVHAISEYREYLLGNHETIICRTFLLEKYGHVKELRALFDLEKIPLKMFYRLGDFVEESKKVNEKEKSKFITECCIFYKEHHPDECIPAPSNEVKQSTFTSWEEDGETEEGTNDGKRIKHEEEIESWADAAAHADAGLYSKFDRF